MRGNILLLTSPTKPRDKCSIGLEFVASGCSRDMGRHLSFHRQSDVATARSALGYSSGFTIMDREDSERFDCDVVASSGIDPKEMRFPKADVLADILVS